MAGEIMSEEWLGLLCALDFVTEQVRCVGRVSSCRSCLSAWPYPA